jgi:hypothetical protein
MLALYTVVAPGQWLGKIMGDVTVEFFVIVVANFASRTSPQRFGVVDRFPLRDDFLPALQALLQRRRLRALVESLA